MSEPLPFDKVKTMNQTCKDLIFGYIRDSQSLLKQNKPYYQIHESIQYIILLFYYNAIDSSILTPTESDQLLSLLEQNNKFKDLGDFNYNLIYIGSKDGFEYKQFVEKCFNHSNIFIIIHTQSDNVFGAYTSVGWVKSAKDYDKIADPKAFLFSIRCSQNCPAFIANFTKSTQALSSYDDYYCYFSSSLWICSGCDKMSGSHIGQDTYKWHDVPDTFCINANESNFKVTELEVFQLK